MAKTFKVGDKVRILDVSKIDFGDEWLENGDIRKVNRVDRDGDIYVEVAEKLSGKFIIVSSEFHAIELVEETPKLTKKARIESLERRVEELENRLVEQKGVEPVTSVKITSVNDVKLGDKIAVEGYVSIYLRANSSYEVVGLSSEKSGDREKIVVLDDDGDNYDIPPVEFAKLRKVAS